MSEGQPSYFDKYSPEWLQRFDEMAQRTARRGLNLPVEGPLSEEDIHGVVMPESTGPPLFTREFLTREERPAAEIAKTATIPPWAIHPEIQKAAYNTVVDTANFLNSKEGAAITMATGGAGALKPAAGRLIGMGFTALAANGAAQALMHGDIAGALEALGLTALMGKGVRHAAKAEFPVRQPQPEVQPIQPGALVTEGVAPEGGPVSGREAVFVPSTKPPQYQPPAAREVVAPPVGIPAEEPVAEAPTVAAPTTVVTETARVSAERPAVEPARETPILEVATEEGVAAAAPEAPKIEVPAEEVKYLPKEERPAMTVGAASREEFMRRYAIAGARHIVEGHTELGDWARHMVEEEPSIPREDLPEIYQRSGQLVNDLQTAGATTSDISRLIKRATGQTKPREARVEVGPMAALKDMYRQLEAVGRAGFRRGVKETKAEAKVRMDQALETLRTAEDWLKADVNTVRTKLLSMAKNLPLKARGKFIPAITTALAQPSLFSRDPLVLRRRGEALLNRMVEKIYDVRVKDTIKEMSSTFKRIEKSPTVKLDTKLGVRRMAQTFDALKDRMSLDMLERMHDRLLMTEQFGRDLFVMDKVLEKAATDAAMNDILAQPARRIDEPTQLKPAFFKSMTERQRAENWLRQRFEAGKRIPPGMQRFLAGLTTKDWLFAAFDREHGGPIYRHIKLPIDIAYSHFLDLTDKYKRQLGRIVKEQKLDEENFRRIYAHAELRQEGGEANLLESGYTKPELDSVQNFGSLELGERIWLREADRINNELYPLAERILREKMGVEIGPKVPGYFPRRVSPEDYADIRMDDRQNPRLLHAFGRRRTHAGATIARQPGAVTRNELNAFDVMNDHIDELLYHIMVGPEQARVGKIIESPEFGNHVGRYGHQLFKDWNATVAANGGVKGSAFWGKMRRNVGMAQLGIRMTTVGLQLLSVINAMPKLGEKNGLRAVQSVGTLGSTGARNRAWILKNFPEVRARVGDDPFYGAQYARERRWFTTVREKAFAPITYLDRAAAMTVAEAAYRDYMQNHNLPFDRSAPINQEGVQHAQRIVRMTQASTAPKDLPGIMAHGGELAKMLLQFQTFSMNMASQLKHDGLQIGMHVGATPRETLQKKLSKESLTTTARTLGYLYLGSLVYELGRDGINEMVALMLGRGAEEERRLKKERGKGYALDVSLRAATNMAVSNSVGSYLWGQWRYRHASGVPVLDEGSQLTAGIKSMATAKTYYGKAKGAVRATQAGVGLATGLPVGQPLDLAARWLDALEAKAAKPKQYKMSEELREPKEAREPREL